MSKQIAKPGMMLYFDTIESIVHMTSKQQGELFMACYHFAKDGILPTFSSPELELAWHFFRLDLVRGDADYYKTCINRGYAAYVREATKKGHTVMEFELWLQTQKKYTYDQIERAGFEECLPPDAWNTTRACPTTSDEDPLA